MRTRAIQSLHMIADLNASLSAATAVGFVVGSSYMVAKFGSLLVLSPQMVWPLWPGCAFLVAILLLTPKKKWPAFLAAGLVGFVLYDLQAGLTIRSIALLILADTVEILTAALGVTYALGDRPQINSLKSLAKYSFFAVILAPLFVASVGSFAVRGNYEVSWTISFLTEALGLLTLTPAILSWADEARTQARRNRYLELLLLLLALIYMGNITFLAQGNSNHPALLYGLVPFLLWSALRFGVMGVSASLNILAVLAVWGAIHARGPFIGASPLDNVLTLQLFLLITSCSFMVLASLVEERKQTLLESRESEQRFRLVANTAPVMIWMSGPDKLCTYFNQPWLEFTGRPLESQLGNGWVQAVHPEDLDRCLNTYTQAFDRHERFRMEYRLRFRNTEYRWVLDIGVPRFNTDGSFAGYIGSCIDVTDQKVAEEALSSMSRRLIEAHEHERTWIARELHDDINQRLAFLAVTLSDLKRMLPASATEVGHCIGEVHQQVGDLGRDVQTLSHRLHSSKLEYLGLSTAAQAFCRELSERQEVEIDFQGDAIPRTLSQEISLCLFRVLQEALQNATKHSGSRHFQVFLKCSLEEINLTVSDSGIGFRPEEAIKAHGLGITSMRERLKLVNGQLFIESKLQRGTTVFARVPYSPQTKPVTTVESF